MDETTVAKIKPIGIGTPLAERPSHTTDRTDRVTSGSSFAEATADKSAANDRMNRAE